MSGKTDIFENDFLKLIFHGTAISGIADNSATPITPPISVGVGVIPRLTPASAITED